MPFGEKKMYCVFNEHECHACRCKVTEFYKKLDK